MSGRRRPSESGASSSGGRKRVRDDTAEAVVRTAVESSAETVVRAARQSHAAYAATAPNDPRGDIDGRAENAIVAAWRASRGRGAEFWAAVLARLGEAVGRDAEIFRSGRRHSAYHFGRIARAAEIGFSWDILQRTAGGAEPPVPASDAVERLALQSYGAERASFHVRRLRWAAAEALEALRGRLLEAPDLAPYARLVHGSGTSDLAATKHGDAFVTVDAVRLEVSLHVVAIDGYDCGGDEKMRCAMRFILEPAAAAEPICALARASSRRPLHHNDYSFPPSMNLVRAADGARVPFECAPDLVEK